MKTLSYTLYLTLVDMASDMQHIGIIEDERVQ